MKKKFQLVLPLLTLPLLTSCPATPDGPLFEVKEFDNSKLLQFRLNDGVDLTVPYGLYNKRVEQYHTSMPDYYMFFAANSEGRYYEEVEWQCIYRITEPNRECYWEGSYLSKEAKIHLDSKFFDPESDVITICLAYVPTDKYQAEKETYSQYDICNPDSRTYYYYIDEDQTVYLSYYITELPNYVEESSSDSTPAVPYKKQIGY